MLDVLGCPRSMAAILSPRHVTVECGQVAEKRLPVAGIGGRLGSERGFVCVPLAVVVLRTVSPCSLAFVQVTWYSDAAANHAFCTARNPCLPSGPLAAPVQVMSSARTLATLSHCCAFSAAM